jgi:hypothetical protein
VSLQINTKEVRPVMALTFRQTGALLATSKGRGLLAIGALMGLVIGVAVVVVFPDAHPHALNAAGAFHGTPISGVQNFVSKLQDSLVWLGSTAMGLVIAVVAIMFMAGHSRAHDVAIKTIVGLAILASISGIVA